MHKKSLESGARFAANLDMVTTILFTVLNIFYVYAQEHRIQPSSIPLTSSYLLVLPSEDKENTYTPVGILNLNISKMDNREKDDSLSERIKNLFNGDQIQTQLRLLRKNRNAPQFTRENSILGIQIDNSSSKVKTNAYVGINDIRVGGTSCNLTNNNSQSFAGTSIKLSSIISIVDQLTLKINFQALQLYSNTNDSKVDGRLVHAGTNLTYKNDKGVEVQAGIQALQYRDESSQTRINSFSLLSPEVAFKIPLNF